ncbi:hypothetical protein [Bosea sp. MMO-172]|uniref:hypothetical protein n=1 Tax=Bosea sp. MMO-172 TaxID=3127885 RepID=UPI0030183EB0
MPRRDPKSKHPKYRISIPDNVSPHVKLVFAEMQRQSFTYDEMAWVSGVQRAALKAWRVKNYPSLTSLEAVLGALGYDFVPVPRAEALPQDVMAELKPAAERLKITLPEATRLLVEIVSGIHEGFATAPARPITKTRIACPPSGKKLRAMGPRAAA